MPSELTLFVGWHVNLRRRSILPVSLGVAGSLGKCWLMTRWAWCCVVLHGCMRLFGKKEAKYVPVSIQLFIGGLEPTHLWTQFPHHWNNAKTWSTFTFWTFKTFCLEPEHLNWNHAGSSLMTLVYSLPAAAWEKAAAQASNNELRVIIYILRHQCPISSLILLYG